MRIIYSLNTFNINHHSTLPCICTMVCNGGRLLHTCCHMVGTSLCAATNSQCTHGFWNRWNNPLCTYVALKRSWRRASAVGGMLLKSVPFFASTSLRSSQSVMLWNSVLYQGHYEWSAAARRSPIGSADYACNMTVKLNHITHCSSVTLNALCNSYIAVRYGLAKQAERKAINVVFNTQ